MTVLYEATFVFVCSFAERVSSGGYSKFKSDILVSRKDKTSSHVF